MVINVKDAPYGAAGDGSDVTTEIQEAIDAASELGETVFFPAGTYLITATLKQPYGVTLSGEGPGSIIKVGNEIDGVTPGQLYAIEATHDDYVINLDGDIVPELAEFGIDAHGNFWRPVEAQYFTVLEKLVIDASDNTNDPIGGLTLYNTEYDYNCCVMDRVTFIGGRDKINGVADKTVTGRHRAFRAYHTKKNSTNNNWPEGRPNDLHNNVFEKCNFIYLYAPECVLFEGDYELERRANNNLFLACRFSQYRTAVRIGGIGNRLISCIINKPHHPVYHETDTSLTPDVGENPLLVGKHPAGSDYRLVFEEGYNNACEGCWLERADGEVLISARTYFNTEDLKVPFFASSTNIGLNSITEIADLTSEEEATQNAQSSSEIVVTGDVTDRFAIGEFIWIERSDRTVKSIIVNTNATTGDTVITIADNLITESSVKVYSTAPQHRNYIMGEDYRYVPTLLGNSGTTTAQTLQIDGEETMGRYNLDQEGAIEAVSGYMVIDWYINAVQGNVTVLETIKSGKPGQILYLRSFANGRDITVKHNAALGNGVNGPGTISLTDGQDFDLNNTIKVLGLMYDSIKERWLQIS